MEDLNRLDPEEVKSAPKHPLIIVLDDVRSMHNVGSVFRTADAFGVEAVYLCGYTPCPPHRDIHKTALGATETVLWKHTSSAELAVKDLKTRGYRILPVEQAHNSTNLSRFNWDQQPTALIFGNEVEGVSDKVLALADGVLEIPQFGAKHSLNIAVSAGVVLWEMIKTGITGQEPNS